MNIFKKILIITNIITLLTSVVFGFLYFRLKLKYKNFYFPKVEVIDFKNTENSQPKEEKKRDVVNYVLSGIVIEENGMLKYQNKEVGISFVFPKDLKIRVNITNGDSGKRFSGILKFPSGALIKFGGVTKDFRMPKEGSPTDVLGWIKEDGAYFVKYLWGRYQIKPDEFIPINDDKDQALVIKNHSWGGGMIREKEIAVLINIPNSEFSGIVFIISPPYIPQNNSSAIFDFSQRNLIQEEIDTFYQIISSIGFE